MKLLGDVVSDVATALGFKKCGGCRKRQEALNNWDAKRREGKRRKGQASK
jgi:hypothetical protein